MLEDSPLLRAIELWEKLTGVAPPAADGFFRGGTLGTWRIHDTYVELKEALELDPSEVTATLLMSKFLEEYLKQATTSMSDLLDDPDVHIQALQYAKELRAIVASEEVTKAKESFLLGLKAALASYGALDREDIQKVLNDDGFMAELRRDALRSLKNLRLDQFLEGDSEADGYKPVFVNVIHRWWNINSLLKTMTSMPSGVSLNLIRDPFSYDSYFAFAFRNGGNLFILTDAPQHSHPLQGQMSRKPGRDLDRRIVQNWFPYDLLGMDIDSKGDSVEKAYSDETAVAVYQPDLIPLQKISEIGPAEAIWVTMMLDLIVAKFWRQGFRAKQLSYTAEMIKTAPVLLEHAQKIGLPVVVDNRLEMPALTIADVTEVTKEDEKYLGAIYEQPYKWLEDRYKAQVPEDAINLIAPPRTGTMLLDHKTGEIRLATTKETQRPFFPAEIASAKTRTALVQLSSTKFGSPEELEADRRWLARHNISEHIYRLAKNEYEEREAEVLKWYLDRAKANLPTLLQYAANGKVWVDCGTFPGGEWSHHAGYGSGREHDIEKAKNKDDYRSSFDSDALKRLVHTFMKTHDLRKKGDLYENMAKLAGRNLGGSHYKSVIRRSRYYKDRQEKVYDGVACAITGAKASYTVIFYPTCPAELAVIAGCTVDELPDVLQHWDKFDRYRGNSILNRVDPMVWNIANPWLNLDLCVLIPLSVRGMAQIQKGEHTLPPLDVISEEQAMNLDVAPLRMQLGGKR